MESVTGDGDDGEDTELTEANNDDQIPCTTETQVHSTKRPTKNREQKSTKRRKEEQEDVVMQRAILCMEKAGGSIASKTADDDDIFAQYIATEIRSIDDAQVKRLLKWRIQSLIFNAHSPGFMPQQAYMQHPGSSWEYPRQESSPSPFSNHSSQGPSPSPAHYPNPSFPVPTDGVHY